MSAKKNDEKDSFRDIPVLFPRDENGKFEIPEDVKERAKKSKDRLSQLTDEEWKTLATEGKWPERFAKSED